MHLQNAGIKVSPGERRTSSLYGWRTELTIHGRPMDYVVRCCCRALGYQQMILTCCYVRCWVPRQIRDLNKQQKWRSNSRSIKIFWSGLSPTTRHRPITVSRKAPSWIYWCEVMRSFIYMMKPFAESNIKFDETLHKWKKKVKNLLVDNITEENNWMNSQYFVWLRFTIPFRWDTFSSF